MGQVRAAPAAETSREAGRVPGRAPHRGGASKQPGETRGRAALPPRPPPGPHPGRAPRVSQRRRRRLFLTCRGRPPGDPHLGGEGPDPGRGRLRQGGSGLRRGGVSGAEGHRGAVATSSRAAPGSWPPHPSPAAQPLPPLARLRPRRGPAPLRSAPPLPRCPSHHRERRGARRARAWSPRAPPGGAVAAGGGAGRT